MATPSQWRIEVHPWHGVATVKPATAEWLERMRLKGKKPPMVFVVVDPDSPSDWFAWRETWALPTLGVTSDVSVDRLDLRVLVGLNVIVITDRYSPWVAGLYEALKSIPVAYVALCVRDWATEDGDAGIHWTAKAGDVALMDPCQ